MSSKEAWVLEPRPIMDPLGKIRRNGVPLAEHAGEKRYGIKTDLNKAFLIDTGWRDDLFRAYPAGAAMIGPRAEGTATSFAIGAAGF
jgi:hypothetical protein